MDIQVEDLEVLEAEDTVEVEEARVVLGDFLKVEVLVGEDTQLVVDQRVERDILVVERREEENPVRAVFNNLLFPRTFIYSNNGFNIWNKEIEKETGLEETIQEIILIADQEKCIKQPVQNVKRNVKCHLNQHKENLFIVGNVSQNAEINNYLSQIDHQNISQKDFNKSKAYSLLLNLQLGRLNPK